MPKLKKFKPPEQEEFENEFRGRYGGCMTVQQVGVEISAEHPDTVKKWLEGVPFIKVNGRRKYRVADVAERFYENRGIA